MNLFCFNLKSLPLSASRDQLTTRFLCGSDAYTRWSPELGLLGGPLCSGCVDTWQKVAYGCTLLRPAIWWSHELRLLSFSGPSLCRTFYVEQTTVQIEDIPVPAVGLTVAVLGNTDRRWCGWNSERGPRSRGAEYKTLT